MVKFCPICGCEVARGGWTFMKGDLPHLNHDEMMACEDIMKEHIKEDAKPEYTYRKPIPVEAQKRWYRILKWVGGFWGKL